jgi:DNA-binding transcriptional ArsR family regulator
LIGEPTAASTKRAAPVFAALGDRTRLKLVARLCAAGPLPTPRLTAGSRISRQALAKHLRVLSQAGLVRAQRRGREAVWELQPEHLRDAQGYLDEIGRQWDRALGSLKAFVEGTP